MSPRVRRLSLSLGPALIVGSVVLGPGSILTASRVGCDFAYDLLWIVVVAAVLMIAMTVLSAHLGSTLAGTPCEELAQRAGRPFAAFVGLVLFGVVACFQFSNNVGVLAAVTPFVGAEGFWPYGLLLAMNAAVVLAVVGFRRLYLPVERIMKVFVGLMILGFVVNLLLAGASLVAVVGGLVPRLPEGNAGDLLPRLEEGKLHDSFWPVQALVGTTFSVAAAFYQAYLVRKKGWGEKEVGRGLIDSVVGISILGLLTIVIMTTAASVLHGRMRGEELRSAADVALALEPLFGSGAKLMFCTGLLAGALSSFLGNVMIGGLVLSDSLGLGGDMDGRWPRRFTIAALVVGMVVAFLVQESGRPPVNLVIFAQALTVLGNPILAGVLLWLALRPRASGVRRVPRWSIALAFAGFLVVLFLALRTGLRLYLGS